MMTSFKFPKAKKKKKWYPNFEYYILFFFFAPLEKKREKENQMQKWVYHACELIAYTPNQSI